VPATSKGKVDLGGAARPLAPPACPRSASQRGHYAGTRNFAHGVVRAISDVDIPRLIDGNAIQGTEASITACSVSNPPGSGESRQRGHYTGRRNFAYGKVAGIGDIDIPSAV